MISIGVNKECTAVEMLVQGNYGTSTLTISYELAYLYSELLEKCARAVENNLESQSESEGEPK